MPDAKQVRLILAAGVVLQVIVLVSMIAIHAAPLMFGQTVLLRVVPLDPRDMFRGDYVILGYEFNQVPANQIEGLPIDTRADGRPVYVTLVLDEDGRHMKPERYSVDRPSSGTYIAGRVEGYNILRFGIEAFYVQEGKGVMYEEAIRDRRLSAEIAVTSRGQAAVRGLILE
jgi:uncharacterized membrane-anchored protein